MTEIDHSKLKATPETEDFAGKYENEGVIAKYLVTNYFKSVRKLLEKIPTVQSAHEIGIGEGRSTSILSELVPNLSGSEFVEHLVPLAKKNNPTLSIFQESVYELKYENEHVDLVFLLEVLEHLDYLKDLGNTPGHLNHWSKKSLIKLIEAKFGKVIAVENPIPWTIVLAKKHTS